VKGRTTWGTRRHQQSLGLAVESTESSKTEAPRWIREGRRLSDRIRKNRGRNVHEHRKEDDRVIATHIRKLASNAADIVDFKTHSRVNAGTKRARLQGSWKEGKTIFETEGRDEAE